MWSKEKQEKQKEYFREQRTNKTGNFTEFVVRTYYCIYKTCAINNTNYCLVSEVTPYKIKNIIYEGIYGGQPDHDYNNVINNCFTHLENMQYIHYDNSKSREFIFIDKPLDFLLEGEHGYYLKKYNIKNEISLDKENTITMRKAIDKMPLETTSIDCDKCHSGKYALRVGKYGYFYGCSNYPDCKNTKNISDFIYTYLVTNGIKIYEMKTNCWSCGKEISLISYFPEFDFISSNTPFPAYDDWYTVKLGAIPSIDKQIMEKYSNIDTRFSKLAGFSYPVNICPHCNNIQGGKLALSSMHDYLQKELENKNIEKFVIEKMKIYNNSALKEDLKEMVSDLETLHQTIGIF